MPTTTKVTAKVAVLKPRKPQKPSDIFKEYSVTYLDKDLFKLQSPKRSRTTLMHQHAIKSHANANLKQRDGKRDSMHSMRW